MSDLFELAGLRHIKNVIAPKRKSLPVRPMVRYKETNGTAAIKL
jgi:hypothetical protein